MLGEEEKGKLQTPNYPGLVFGLWGDAMRGHAATKPDPSPSAHCVLCQARLTFTPLHAACSARHGQP